MFKKLYGILPLVLLLTSLFSMFNVATVKAEDQVATRLQTIFMVNDTVGYAGGGAGLLLKIQNGGQNWDILEWEHSGDVSKIVNKMFFLDENEGWLTVLDEWVSAYVYLYNLYHTTDGGNTWDLIWESDTTTFIADIYFFNSSYGWGVGKITYSDKPYGGIYRTYDGGNTWQAWKRTGLPYGLAYELCVLDAEHAWWVYAGDDDGVMYYNIPFERWSRIEITDARDSRHITFTNYTHGFLTTRYGKIFVSTDGGLNWTEIIHLNASLGDIQFYNETLGWTCSGGGHIYNTTNAGQTWNLEYYSYDMTWFTLAVQHSEPVIWCGGGENVPDGFETGSADIATIMQRGSPWKIQLGVRSTFEITYQLSTYDVSFKADSTITNFVYDAEKNTITFKVFGPGNYTGHCNVTIPKSVVSKTIQMKIDGENILDVKITQNVTHYFVYITYKHSIHDIETDMDALLGDFNGDDKVNIFDVVMIAGCYGTSEGEEDYHGIYDVNYDSEINIFDLVSVAGNYGEEL